jgi:hypothetical protein
MWQIEWMVGLLPTWAFHSMVTAGIALIVASWVLKRIPFVSQYNFPIYVIGTTLTIAGVWYSGMRESQSVWADRVKEMEAQVQVAEARSQQVNTVIETQIVERVKIVKDTKNANKETAKLIARQLDSKCVVPESTVVLLNSASQNEVARSTLSTDGSASDVRASEVVETVVENYGRYNELREKVIAWQNWYRDQKKIYEGDKQ